MTPGAKAGLTSSIPGGFHDFIENTGAGSAARGSTPDRRASAIDVLSEDTGPAWCTWISAIKVRTCPAMGCRGDSCRKTVRGPDISLLCAPPFHADPLHQG